MVAPAQLEPVDPQFAGGIVDQPLHVIIAFRPPRAAIGGLSWVVLVNTHLVVHLEQRRAIEADGRCWHRCSRSAACGAIWPWKPPRLP